MRCRLKVSRPILIFLFSVLQLHLNGQLRNVYTDSDAANPLLRTSYYSQSEGYAAFQKWIGYTQDSGHSFSKIYLDQTPVYYNGFPLALANGFGISGVTAIDKNKLFVYGSFFATPSILYSLDGGQSFTLVFYSLTFGQGLTEISDVVMQNSGVGYAIDYDRILRTTNSGQTWQVIKTEIGARFSNLQLLKDGQVVVTGYTKIFMGTNQGNSWQIKNTSSTNTGSWFMDINKGWLVKENGEIYFTNNSGVNWQLMNSPEYRIFNRGNTRIRFIDDSTGYALSNPYRVIKTTDSGRIWEPLEREPSSVTDSRYNELFFIDNNQFWAGGEHGLLELTTNAGGITMPISIFKPDVSNITSGVVQLINYSKKGNLFSWYRNGQLFATTYNASYFTSNSIDTIMLVVAKLNYRDTSFTILDNRIKPDPCKAGFSISNDTSLVKLTSNYNSAGVKHYWNFGDSTTDLISINPVHVYQKAGSYQITHKVFNPVDGCSDSSAQSVNIVRTRNCFHGNIKYEADSFYSSKIQFKFVSDPDVEPNPSLAATPSWNFGDGEAENALTPVHVYDSSGTYIVSVTLDTDGRLVSPLSGYLS